MFLDGGGGGGGGVKKETLNGGACILNYSRLDLC